MRPILRPVFVAGKEYFAGSHCIVKDDIGCILVASARASDTQIHQLAPMAGIALPKAPGAISCVGTLRSFWLTPHSWLVLCTLEEEETFVARINLAFPTNCVHAASYTDYLCWFELSGRNAMDLLTQGGFVSLEPKSVPVGHAKRTLLSGVAVVILRNQDSQWLVGVERSRSRYFADWMRVAARRAVDSEVPDQNPISQPLGGTIDTHSLSK